MVSPAQLDPIVAKLLGLRMTQVETPRRNKLRSKFEATSTISSKSKGKPRQMADTARACAHNDVICFEASKQLCIRHSEITKPETVKEKARILSRRRRQGKSSIQAKFSKGSMICDKEKCATHTHSYNIAKFRIFKKIN
eukprot:Gregarina_sp_Poly_1__9574@NODE_604_length_7213_cov_176_066331_g464_i0_p4_GENE_NODE_604_length_7213_cov_176_066331_g464_i0NODE_604_length_7213_cov_176_066331_g464_i0_p4_ORF_typecomplete_len139_score11_81FAM217/PF15344_6/0_033_NODE_604_length_7213_cov_176_066331_g464_i019435